jgi:type IV secretory pathway VirJ component
LPPPPLALGGLPILEIPASTADAQSTFAILMSGDGGWSGFEQHLAEALAARGIAVIGFDTLRYFWSRRTPATTASDIDRIVRYYLLQQHKDKVLLLGYSEGADVLPFIYNRLPAATRQRVLLSAQLGLGDRAEFGFRLDEKSAEDAADDLPTMPELRKLENSPLLCISGTNESDSMCPQLDPHRVHMIRFKGGHDAGADYHKIAEAIVDTARLDREH